jgi:hypothetical protein
MRHGFMIALFNRRGIHAFRLAKMKEELLANMCDNFV